MVYETDFYTVRRPYTRPTITSYSVTGCRPSVWRPVQISPIGTHSKVRLSILLGELNRIQTRPRMHLSYVPTEDFLNSRPLVEFDDETKYIRAEADKLMKYIYVSVPHTTSKLPPKFTTSYDRLTSNGYNPYRSGIPNDIVNMSYYNEPTRNSIGRGHLACVTFAGGRGYPRRKHLFADEYRDIRDDIKVRSYYNKNIHHTANRIDEEALALPTGFAARLFSTDRTAYVAPDEERKTNSLSKIRRNEKLQGKMEKSDKIQKKEKFLDDDLIIQNDKKINKLTEEISENKEKQNSMENNAENDITLKKIEENIEIKKNDNEISKIKTKNVSSEDVPKVKKESGRKLSKKLSSTDLEDNMNDVSKEIVDFKKEIQEKPVEEIKIIDIRTVEKPIKVEKPIEEKPLEKEMIIDEKININKMEEIIEPVEKEIIDEKPVEKELIDEKSIEKELIDEIPVEKELIDEIPVEKELIDEPFINDNIDVIEKIDDVIKIEDNVKVEDIKTDVESQINIMETEKNIEDNVNIDAKTVAMEEINESIQIENEPINIEENERLIINEQEIINSPIIESPKDEFDIKLTNNLISEEKSSLSITEVHETIIETSIEEPITTIKDDEIEILDEEHVN